MESGTGSGGEPSYRTAAPVDLSQPTDAASLNLMPSPQFEVAGSASCSADVSGSTSTSVFGSGRGLEKPTEPPILRTCSTTSTPEDSSRTNAASSVYRRPGQELGIVNRQKGQQGRFTWHGREVSTICLPRREEAVRIRDRLAIICDFIDEKTGWEPRLRGDILNRPRSDYEGEKFFAALQRGELELPPCGAQREDHRDRVRTFLEQHGGYDCPPVVPRCIANTCTKSASVPPDDSTTSTELPRALPSSSSAAPGSGVSLLHDRDHDPNSNASVINIATPTNANSKRIKKESASDSEEKESNQSESEEDDEERTDNGDEAAATKTRWRELHKSGQMIVEDVFKLDGGYYAAFFLESEKVVSPPLASVDEALRFVDRCRVAWFGPDGENRYGMKIHFPIEEYASEGWYRKLFDGHRWKGGSVLADGTESRISFLPLFRRAERKLRTVRNRLGQITAKCPNLLFRGIRDLGSDVPGRKSVRRVRFAPPELPAGTAR